MIAMYTQLSQQFSGPWKIQKYMYIVFFLLSLFYTENFHSLPRSRLYNSHPKGTRKQQSWMTVFPKEEAPRARGGKTPELGCFCPGGGFNDFLFSPLPGEMIQVD